MMKKILGLILFSCLILGICNAAPIKVLCWTADEARKTNNKYRHLPGMMAEALATMIKSDTLNRFAVTWAHEDNAALQTANLEKYDVLVIHAYNDVNGTMGDTSHIETMWRAGKLKVFGLHEIIRQKMPTICGFIDGLTDKGTISASDLFNLGSNVSTDHPLLKNVQVPFALPINEAYLDLNLLTGTQVILKYGLCYLLTTHISPDHKGVSIYFQAGDPELDPIYLDPIPQVKQIFWNGIEWLTTQTFIDKPLTNSQKAKNLSYPNPFNPECYISISGQQSAVSKIKIYNILGQVVRELNANNGSSSIYWDGRDNFGKELSSGMYFYEILVNNQVQNCKKMLMLK